MKPARPMTLEDFNQSDEELGRWFFDTWCAHHFEKYGLPLEQVTEDHIEFMRARTLEVEAETVESAALESMLRKAAKGKFADAGKMLRAHMMDSAFAILAEKYAPMGVEQTALRMRGGQASAAARGKKASDWQARCIEHARALLATGTAPHELAGKCAQKFKRSPDTIRRILKKADVS